MKMSEKMQRNVQMQESRACQIYHTCYDNTSFYKATSEKTSKYANALIDAALAICGHPSYALTHRNWSADAIAFLEKFDADLVFGYTNRRGF